MSDIFEILDAPKDLQRGLYPATVVSFQMTPDGREIRVQFDLGEIGKVEKFYPKKFTSDTDEKKELEDIAQKPLRLANADDFLNRRVVAFVALKRGSGGRIVPAIGPVLSLEVFTKMATAIT